ncbi:MAG: T9SS type A sorting domain-containing protein, partial [Bacteroidia bacterium]|nr:T9SS type A sorting domain-containing protein [Bacteroidia bacterium]
ANQKVYLHDKYTNTYFDLRSKEAYGFTSERGRIEDRFEIVFKAKNSKKDLEVLTDNTSIFYNTTTDMLYVKGLEANAESLVLVNMLGQQVMRINTPSKESLENGIHINNLNSGVYIVSIALDNNQTMEKKIIIN